MTQKTNIVINISGGGKPANVSAALRQIAMQIESGEHINSIEERGKCEWEDSNLFVKIEEDI